MVKFNIQNGKLVIDPSTLTVAAFKAIWDYDTSKDKVKASNMLTYVYHMADITKDNPFLDVAASDKEALCKLNDFGSKTHKFKQEEEQLIGRAIEWYDELNKDSIRRLAKTLDKKIDEINNYLDENPINGDNFMDQVKVLKEIDTILQKKEKVDIIISKQITKIKTQGDTFRSPNEKKLIGYKGKK